MPCLFLVAVIGGDWRWKISIGKLDDLSVFGNFAAILRFRKIMCAALCEKMHGTKTWNYFEVGFLMIRLFPPMTFQFPRLQSLFPFRLLVH